MVVAAMTVTASRGLGGRAVAMMYVEIEDGDSVDRGVSVDGVRCPNHDVIQKAR